VVIIAIIILGAYAGFSISSSTSTFAVTTTSLTSITTAATTSLTSLKSETKNVSATSTSAGSEVTSPVSSTTSSSTSNSTQITTSCSISTEPAGIFLHVVTDGTPTPIYGAKVSVTPVGTCFGLGPTTTLPTLSENFTNSSGWLSIPGLEDYGGAYYLVFHVQYQLNSTFNFSKTFNVQWAPQSGTFVTLSLPSGTITSQYLLPLSCNYYCYFDNVAQVVTIIGSLPVSNYSVSLYTNNTLTKTSPISNVTLTTASGARTQVIQFYVSPPSFVFVAPSFRIIPNSNGSAFYLTYENGTVIATAFDQTNNLLYTTEQVQGWILVNSAA
jgi:hypothetical protein